MANRATLELNGNFFESLIASSLASAFPEAKVLHNLEVYSVFLKKNTQVDVLLVHPTGIFVIEAKNWTDWVRGGYNDRQWSGASNHGAPITTRSPLDQNFLHVRTLKRAFRVYGYKPPTFYNLVVFPDGVNITSDCKEVCTFTQIESRIRSLVLQAERKFRVESCVNVLRQVAKEET